MHRFGGGAAPRRAAAEFTVVRQGTAKRYVGFGARRRKFRIQTADHGRWEARPKPPLISGSFLRVNSFLGKVTGFRGPGREGQGPTDGGKDNSRSGSTSVVVAAAHPPCFKSAGPPVAACWAAPRDIATSVRRTDQRGTSGGTDALVVWKIRAERGHRTVGSSWPWLCTGASPRVFIVLSFSERFSAIRWGALRLLLAFPGPDTGGGRKMERGSTFPDWKSEAAFQTVATPERFWTWWGGGTGKVG